MRKPNKHIHYDWYNYPHELGYGEPYTVIEKINSIINQLNKYRKINEDMLEKWSEVYGWVMDNGLDESVGGRLREWLADGRLEDVINTSLFNTKADKVVVEEMLENIKVIRPIEGVEDYSEVFTKAFRDYSYIIVKNGNYNVDVSKIGDIESNTHLEFEPKAKMFVIPNTLERYELLNVKNVDNVTIVGANLEGDKHTHLSNGGQWGMGINIVGSRNIRVVSPTCNRFWGDGIYTAGCENVEVVDAKCDDNRRQGISIISGKDISFIRPTCSNTHGQNPSAGIDIEPNQNHDHLDNVRVIDPLLYNNGNDNTYDYGIVISLANRASSKRRVDVTVERPNIPKGSIVVAAEPNNVGTVNIHDAKVNDADDSGILIWNKSEGLQVNFYNPIVTNPNRTKRDIFYVAGIKIQQDSGEVHTPIQNILIDSPVLRTDEDNITTAIGLSDYTQTYANYRNVKILNAKVIGGFARSLDLRRSGENNLKYSPSLTVTYNEQMSRAKFPAWGSTIRESMRLSNIVYDIDAPASNYGWVRVEDRIKPSRVEMYIENQEPNNKPLRIEFESEKHVYPLTDGKVKYIELPGKYSYVVLNKVSTDSFAILETNSQIKGV